MAKMTKRKLTLHDEAMDLVRLERDLTMREKEFVLEHYKPYATHNVTETNAFFTPSELAMAATIEMPNPDEYVKPVRILDICSGIGMLSFAYYHYSGYDTSRVEIVCVEYEEEYVKVGKKILPEATWVQGDILEDMLLDPYGLFDCFISNPPFMKMGQYKGTYNAAQLGMEVSKYGVMIVPQCNCPFRYSGQSQYTEEHNRDYNKFEDTELIKFSVSCIDTETIDDCQWDDVNVTTEIVIVEDLVENPRAIPEV